MNGPRITATVLYIGFFGVIGYAVWLTGSAAPLWALLLLPGFSTGKNEEDDTPVIDRHNPGNPNSGHGHVYPRPDHNRARCGGPRMCCHCAADLAHKQTTPADTRLVTVCAECLQASCWRGIFLCDKAQNADTLDLPVYELQRLNREHPDYWKERTP